jgi:DNA-binding response OmpR family regulator
MVEGALMTQRVMIVDDHPETLEVMREVLTNDGYDVVAVEGIDEDLRQVVAAKPDLLIVDLLLTPDPAGLSGWDIVKLARAHRHLAGMEILVVSADLVSLRGHIREASSMSHVRLLGKPFALDALTVMVADALRGSTDESLPAAEAVTFPHRPPPLPAQGPKATA